MIELKKFLKIVFRAPNPKKSIIAIWILGFVYGFLTYFLINNTISLALINVPVGFGLLIYIMPALIYAGIAHTVIKNFYKRRAYLLALINETLLFIGFISITFVSSPQNLINLMWWWIAFIYSIDVLSILGSFGKNGKLVSIFYSLLYPGIIVVVLYFFYGMYLYGPQSMVMLRSLGLLGLGVSIVLIINILDYLFGLNVPGLSSLELFSAFLNKEPLKLKGGKEINTKLQSLKFDIGDELVTLSIPWIHPGPLSSLGGGPLSRKMIKGLNENGKGFFWHMPSCHEQDPTDFSITGDLVDKSQEVPEEFYSNGTKLVKLEKDQYVLYGQKIGDFYLIFLELEGEDDYDISIFREIRRRLEEKIVFVDTHNHVPIENNESIMTPETEEAEFLEDMIVELIEKLDQEEKTEIEAGIDILEDEISFMSLVMKAGDQKNIFLTLDTNGFSSELRKKLMDTVNQFKNDNVVLITTDAHEEADVYSQEEKVDIEKIESSLGRAFSDLKDANIGLLEKELKDVKVLGRDYHTIKSSVTLVTHLFPFLLIALYLSVLLILFGI